VPIYEYCCVKCGYTFEKIVLIAAPISCPECGSTKVEQMVSAPAIHNTSAKNDILNREYKNYRKRWNENAYVPKSKKRSKD